MVASFPAELSALSWCCLPGDVLISSETEVRSQPQVLGADLGAVTCRREALSLLYPSTLSAALLVAPLLGFLLLRRGCAVLTRRCSLPRKWRSPGEKGGG